MKETAKKFWYWVAGTGVLSALVLWVVFCKSSLGLSAPVWVVLLSLPLVLLALFVVDPHR